jgi:hypothetical protein
MCQRLSVMALVASTVESGPVIMGTGAVRMNNINDNVNDMEYLELTSPQFNSLTGPQFNSLTGPQCNQVSRFTLRDCSLTVNSLTEFLKKQTEDQHRWMLELEGHELNQSNAQLWSRTVLLQQQLAQQENLVQVLMVQLRQEMAQQMNRYPSIVEIEKALTDMTVTR